MDKEKARDLLVKYRKGLCSEEEKRIVETWFDYISGESGWTVPFGEAEATRERMHANILQGIEKTGPVIKISRSRKMAWYAAAAVLFLALAANLAWFLQGKQEKRPLANVIDQEHDILPGQSGAILTLANGEEIVLDSLGNGILTTQGSTKVIKTGDQISYQGADFQQQVVYNTISTPIGRTFRVMLPDSTKVWLNAASSITYPTAFNTNTREVSITGEAYFEVTHRPDIVFRVKAGTEILEDLGTSFNVNTYNDEPVQKTTLVEGKLKIRNVILEENDQVSIHGNGKLVLDHNVDVENILAWKNGHFRFNSVDIYSIMRQVSRWYGVAVEYQTATSIGETFSGGISRDVKLSELLHILEVTGKLNFEMRDKTIIIKS
ncbi:hypothetical protein COR50_20020 [Chitinophaga caeni]|uniref:Iron dicitrate transport regulator FecR n=1 Tax=Chitinophaga caeni TaxID=2029983 RepID=A0A291QZ64_9BACT|nr:FecR family protein [Chitinophaga caeni]ATL49276.1 hypothetical protein COR50_20020 [Chitinophaga caeni]